MPDDEANETLETLLQGLSETAVDGDEYIPSTDIELTHEIVSQLYDNNNIKMISDLTERQITGILKLESINHILYRGEKSTISILIDNFLTLQISKYRQGRSELVRAISNTGEDENTIKSKFKRFIG